MVEDKIRLSFEEISQGLQSFPFPPIDLVVAIATGGTIPGCLIAHQLRCELLNLRIEYRDDQNKIKYDSPKLVNPENLEIDLSQRILIVDDVSVTGSTLATASSLFPDHEATTFVLKGKADLVLFPEITQCILWPWR